MPTINITNNSDVNVSASSADANATLNRYLTSVLTFTTPPSFGPIASLLVKDQNELAFPITLPVSGEANFALKKTTLTVQAGVSGAIGLIRSDEADFLAALSVGGAASSSGLVSFAVQATLGVGDTATVSDFTFGLTAAASVTLTSYYVAAANDKLVDAVVKAAAALTIPHDLSDLQSLPAGSICQMNGESSLQFSASATYTFLNDPLAALAIANLPALAINASASATLEGTVTHTADHTLTIAKLPNGLLHLSVSVQKTDDFETSLTVSSGVAANVGSTDALTFLLGLLNPNSAAEAAQIAQQIPDVDGFKADIKAGIDSALSAALAVSLKGALERRQVRNRVFLFEIDLHALGDDSKAALQSALTGDFRAITKAGTPLAGIQVLDSVFTDLRDDTHSIAFHFLGIFNAASISDFVKESKIDFTHDTHELVLSDESIQVVDSNLDAEKLRKLVLKDITLTLPASANTPEANSPITLAYLDRQASTSPDQMRQFANELNLIAGADAGAAQNLLHQKLKNYGTCALFLGLELHPAQCRQLFLDANGKAYDWTYYLKALCAVEKAIFANVDADGEYAFYEAVFGADQETWNALQDAGTDSAMQPILRNLGVPNGQVEAAVTLVMTAVWWSEAMADYATALAKGKSLAAVGEGVVKAGNLGYTEPWMILATWVLAGKPQVTSHFSSSVPLLGAAAKGH